MSEVYAKLSTINVNDHIKTKGSLKYLSWSFAWDNLMKIYPKSTYKIYEKEDINYFTDGRTCWVKVGVTVESIEHIEMLPIMDTRNKSILVNSVTSVDVNKTIQRALTKAIARHGLGIYIYAGEDLPTEEAPKIFTNAKQPQTQIQSDTQKAYHVEQVQYTVKDLKEKFDEYNLTSDMMKKFVSLFGVIKTDPATFTEIIDNFDDYFDKFQVHIMSE